MIRIERFVNRPVQSNCFILYNEKTFEAIIIDPGNEDNSNINAFISNHRLVPRFIILTHEHYDHIWGTNKLKDLYNVNIICSKTCAERIILPKKNISIFHTQHGFSTYPADIIINIFPTEITLCGFTIRFIETPGHSNASICFSVENNLFTGDTIIKNEKIITKLLDGNSQKLMDSLKLILNSYAPQTIIHPGHGESFQLNELIIDKLF